ncbi:MAG: hypothetical protein ACXV99_13950 [Candidatus Angelobacter sp.]
MVEPCEIETPGRSSRRRPPLQTFAALNIHTPIVQRHISAPVVHGILSREIRGLGVSRRGTQNGRA